MEPSLMDAAGHRRSPVTMPGYHRGRPPRNKGRRYPADPPPIDEIIAVMRAAGGGREAARLRALIVLLWRAGLRVSEALDLAESDLGRHHGGILIRRGKGGKRREVGMDSWAWQQLCGKAGAPPTRTTAEGVDDAGPRLPRIPWLSACSPRNANADESGCSPRTPVAVAQHCGMTPAVVHVR